MKKNLLTGVLFLLIGKFAFSQCIYKQLVQEGFQFTNYKYFHFTSDDTHTYYATVYTFYPDGKVYYLGNTWIKNTIDIKQAVTNASKYRSRADSAIKAHAGKTFFSKLNFQSVSIDYPEPTMMSDSVFENSTLYREDSVLRKLQDRAKKNKDNYIFRYKYALEADTLSSYQFDVMIDKFGKVVRDYYFPPESRYKPINKHFTYCQLINIARKAQKHIDPIGSIQLSYNIDDKRFYWVISQHIVDKPIGKYFHIYIVEIDAANFSRVGVKRLKGISAEPISTP